MSAKSAIEAAKRDQLVSQLKADNAALVKTIGQLQKLKQRKAPARVPSKHTTPRAGVSSSFVRVIIPDSHGEHIDRQAARAFLADLKLLAPVREVVMLGDHLDCGGTFSAHQRSYTNEMAESYDGDVNAANAFLDAIQKAAPSAIIDYLEGNHEQHVERWAVRNFASYRDARRALEALGPEAVLRLKARGIRYYRRGEKYDGLSIPGAIRRGKCIFVHGFLHSKHATYNHLIRVGTNIVHGHTHRAQAATERTVVSDGHGAWCPGTLAKLQPLYAHTAPPSWTHGYAVQFVAASGQFLHFNVPIDRGQSLLHLLKGRLK